MNKFLTGAVIFVVAFLAANSALGQAPIINYATPQIYTVNVPIATLSPTRKGGAIPPGGFTINIPLPAGLSLNPDNGDITGTPTQISAATIYTITATNAQGPSQATLNIKVGLPDLPVPPSPAISYTTPNSYLLNTPIPALVLNNSGGEVKPGQSNGLLENYAGTGIAGFNNGQKSTATFDGPGQLILNPTGDLLFPEANNFDIRKISVAGIVTVVATGVGTNGFGVSRPRAMVMDSKGNYYVADGYLIRKITPFGVMSVFAGTGLAGTANGNGKNAGFDGIVSLVIDKNDNIFVADQNNAAIRKITPNGDVSTFAGNGLLRHVDGQGTSASFDLPSGLAFNAAGDLYVADYLSIRKITPGGLVSTVAGNATRTVKDGQGTAASFGNAFAVTFDAEGKLYVLDIGNNVPNEGSDVLRVINQNNDVTTINLVVNGGPRTFLTQPTGFVFDKNGYLFIAGNNNYIQTVSVDRFVIDKPLPTGLVFDKNTGNITGTPTALWPLTAYTITAYNTAGASSAIVNIEVKENNNPPTSLTFAPLPVKSACDVDFDPGAKSPNPIIYTSSNTAVATIVNGQIHIVGPGISTITATSNGESAQNDFRVNDIPQPSVTISAVIPSPACQGASAIVFIAVPNNEGTTPVYQWQVNKVNAGTNSKTFSSNTLVNGDQVTCKVTNNNICPSPVSATSDPITIKDLLNPAPLSVTIAASTNNVYSGTAITFTATPVSTATVTAYNWRVNDASQGTNSPQFSSNTFRNEDRVTCTVTVNNGCTTPAVSNEVKLTILAPPVIKVVNTFTPNGDGANDTWEIPDLSFYPNCIVQIFNRYGAEVLHSAGYNQAWDGTANGKELPAGSYYYIIDTHDGQPKMAGNVTLIR